MQNLIKIQQNVQNGIYSGIPYFPVPARLDTRQTAMILGFKEHDIPVLTSAKMLKPLGKPVSNATKYFATCEIEPLAGDSKWLRDATQIVYNHWIGKNERKTVNVQQLKSAMPAPVLAEQKTAIREINL